MSEGGPCDSVVPTALTVFFMRHPASELAGYCRRSLRDSALPHWDVKSAKPVRETRAKNPAQQSLYSPLSWMVLPRSPAHVLAAHKLEAHSQRVHRSRRRGASLWPGDSRSHPVKPNGGGN